MIDVWKFRKFTIIFTVIGANSIFIYIAPQFLDFEHTNEKLFGGISHFAGNNRDLLMHASYLGMLWFLLYFLYRKKIFLKVWFKYWVDLPATVTRIAFLKYRLIFLVMKEAFVKAVANLLGSIIIAVSVFNWYGILQDQDQLEYEQRENHHEDQKN